jgi:hypothetical protein
MIEHLKRLIARIRSSNTWLRPPGGPADPEIGVREPRWRRPSSGSTAVAVAEPDDQRHSVAALGTVRRSRSG